jgi:hypothetical protein
MRPLSSTDSDRQVLWHPSVGEKHPRDRALNGSPSKVGSEKIITT